MIDGFFVADAVAHGFNWSPGNRTPTMTPEDYDRFVRFFYVKTHVQVEAIDRPGYQLSYEEFSSKWHAEDLLSLYFEESDVDMLAYHDVEIPGIFNHGSSPWDIGVALKRAAPERVLLYAFVDPFRGPAELERMQEKAETCPVDGFKFYPSDGLFDPVTGQPHSMLYDDPEMAYPFFERARDLGVPHIAVHKAVPVGPGRLDKDRVEDLSSAALAFPDVTFEVVHSGFAFVEECALQLMLHRNIYANLESTANLAVRRPQRFAEVLGQFLQAGGEDRVLFGTGAPAVHPQPPLEAVASMTMPQDLVEGYGYPAITPELRAKLLGGNFARLHGFDVETKQASIADDGLGCRRKRDAQPWRAHRERHVSGARASA